jgi:hypothetical protein
MMKKASISDPLGNSGILLLKGTPEEPIFIVKRASLSKPAEVLEKEVQKDSDGHIDEEALVKSVIYDWREYYGKSEPKPQGIPHA